MHVNVIGSVRDKKGDWNTATNKKETIRTGDIVYIGSLRNIVSCAVRHRQSCIKHKLVFKRWGRDGELSN